MGSEKVAVIGIDGLPYDVVASLGKKKLPTFFRIMKKGCYGVLTSTIPPLSPVAWPSLVTGKNPAKHGVFGFSHVKEGIVTPCYCMAGRSNPIWDAVGKAGKKVVVLNVPFTYPPHKVNGILISGFPSPMDQIKSFPPEFINRLKSKIGNYELDVSIKKENYEGMCETDFIDEIFRITEIRAKATLHLMENSYWDFFMSIFTSLDRLQHVFYGYFDKKSPLYDVEKRKILCKYYRRLDEILNSILLMIDESTYLIIVSDHGFDYLYKYVGLNNLLSRRNYLRHGAKFLNREEFKKLWRSYNLFRKIIEALPTELIKAIQTIVPPKEDYSQSIAYCDYQCTITLRKDLAQSVKNELREEIIDYLYSVMDFETSQKVVERIYVKEDILSGSLEEVPDIFILFRRGYEPKRWTETPIQHTRGSYLGGKTLKTGTHSTSYARRGFFSIRGQSIKKNFSCTSSILDITPTILHIWSIPLSSDIDGRVLTEIFSENSEIARRDVKYTHPPVEYSREQYSYSKREEESIRKRLKELGYF